MDIHFFSAMSITKLFLDKTQTWLPQAFRFGLMLPQQHRRSAACSDSLKLSMGFKAVFLMLSVLQFTLSTVNANERALRLRWSVTGDDRSPRRGSDSPLR